MLNILKTFLNKNTDTTVNTYQEVLCENYTEILRKIDEILVDFNKQYTNENKVTFNGVTFNHEDDMGGIAIAHIVADLTFYYREMPIKLITYDISSFLPKLQTHLKNKINYIDDILDNRIKILRHNAASYKTTPIGVNEYLITGTVRTHIEVTLKEVAEELSNNFNNVIEIEIEPCDDYNRSNMYYNLHGEVCVNFYKFKITMLDT